jgi:hypothetical protein
VPAPSERDENSGGSALTDYFIKRAHGAARRVFPVKHPSVFCLSAHENEMKMKLSLDTLFFDDRALKV